MHFKQTEETYMTESQKLAEAFKAKSKEHKQAKSDFKTNLKQMIAEYEQLKANSTDEVKSLSN